MMEGLQDSDDDYDPDYVEDDSSEDDLPPTRGRDRAQWVVDNQEAVEELYRAFQEVGRQLFGEAFFQIGDVTKFAHFIYTHTTPMSSP